MLIRPEQVTDYAAIGAVHALAFGGRASEAAIVALLRQRRAFDPELALVAEQDGQVVGHVLFSPYPMRLLDQTIWAVNLAPLAVVPACQGRSIGGALIAEGHRVARAKGYGASIVLGHPTYYPRFGYQPFAFGTARLVCGGDVLSVAPPGLPLEKRQPSADDVPALLRLWQREEKHVDMALEPGLDLLDWISPHPTVRALVYTRAGEVVGYTRADGAEPARARMFCARDGKAARAMVVALASELRPGAGREIVLPLHPCSASTRVLGQAVCTASAAAMACALDRDGLLDDYLARVRAGQRSPGRVIWPVAFDLG